MTGSEIADWLAGIWYDLLNLDTADVPLLLFKLFVLTVVVFFGWQLGRMLARTLWSVAQPVLRFAWMIVSAPVWVPCRALKWLSRRIGRWRRGQRWRQDELAEAKRVRLREQAEARQQAEALAAAKQLLDAD